MHEPWNGSQRRHRALADGWRQRIASRSSSLRRISTEGRRSPCLDDRRASRGSASPGNRRSDLHQRRASSRAGQRCRARADAATRIVGIDIDAEPELDAAATAGRRCWPVGQPFVDGDVEARRLLARPYGVLDGRWPRRAGYGDELGALVLDRNAGKARVLIVALTAADDGQAIRISLHRDMAARRRCAPITVVSRRIDRCSTPKPACCST